MEYDDYIKIQKEGSAWGTKIPQCLEGHRRYVETTFKDVNKAAYILDVGCGDGVTLKWLKEAGFINVCGIDIHKGKLEEAKKYGYPVHCGDIHDLELPDESFDILLASHVLEHTLWPGKVLGEFYRILKDDGTLLVVLPYPERADDTNVSHTSRQELGMSIDDEADTLCRFFTDKGYTLDSKDFDSYRQSEVWLNLRKD